MGEGSVKYKTSKNGLRTNGEPGEVQQGVSELRHEAGRLLPGRQPVRAPEPMERRLHALRSRQEGQWTKS